MQNQAELTQSSQATELQASSSIEWVRKRIAMAEALTQSPPLDPSSRALMTRLWLKTLFEVGEERFDAALTRVLDSSPHRPSIAEIRRYAGVVTEVPVEREAMDYFRDLLEAMRLHGPQMLPIPGEIVRDKDDEGFVLVKPIRAPDTPAPSFSEMVKDTVGDLGFGSREAGLEAIAAHPALPWNMQRRTGDTSAISYAAHNAQELERRWVDAYKLRKALPRPE